MGSRFQKRRRSHRHSSSPRGRRSRGPEGRPRQNEGRDRPPSEAAAPAAANAAEAVFVNSLPEARGEYLPVLFRRFPELAERLPWVSLRGVSEPSVPRRLLRSHHLFGPNHVFMKEELNDFHIITENQARKLEFHLGELCSRGVKKIIARGEAGDPFLLAVAIAARELGLRSKIYLTKPEGDFSFEGVERTLALFGTGARVRPKASQNALRWSLKFQEWLQSLERSELVPNGVHTPSGALGYANALLELRQQIDDGLMHAPDYLFIATHQGSSLAGLELGRRLAGLDGLKIVGIQTDRHITPDASQIASLASEAGRLLTPFLPSFRGKLDFKASDFSFYVDPELLKENRKEFSDVKRWIIRFEEVEMAELGPDDNARALYSISRFITQNKTTGKKILFWNTYCPYRRGEIPSSVAALKPPGILKSWLLLNPDFKRQASMRAVPTSSK